MGSTCGAETAYRSGAPEFNPGFGRARVAESLTNLFCVVFCRSLFFLILFLCPLYCLSFFELRLLITPLVSSNLSHSLFNLLLVQLGNNTKLD
jgi:hypothetical protein